MLDNDEHNTPVDETGLDNVETSQSDTLPDWDDGDPEEDTAEPKAEEATAEDAENTDGETEDLEDPEAESQQEELIDLGNGEKVSKEELKKGYFRQADYTRSKQELANQRRALADEATRIDRITNALVETVAGMIPPPPDVSLAMTNPSAFVAQKAQHEAALAELQKIFQLTEGTKETKAKVGNMETSELLQRENERLKERFPQTATPKGREQFFERAASAAIDLGFTPEELQNFTDHRMFAVAYYAKRGLEAEKAQKSAQAKVKNAPPVAPVRPLQGDRAASRNAELLKKLSKTGDLRTAMMIDWD